MIHYCPNCGQRVIDSSLPEGLRLTPMLERIFLTVKRAGAGGILLEDLIDRVYADHVDGGPDWDKQSIRTSIHRLNSKLIDYNMIIRAPRGGNHAPTAYTLRKLK